MDSDATRHPVQLGDAPRLPQNFFDDTRDIHSSVTGSGDGLRIEHDVPVVRDKQTLHDAPWLGRSSDQAKRIKNPTWWTRCVLCICCASAQDINGMQ
ncbi:hypothetical protein K503DRAFT_801738 [Rhizopogon vinicolor AM-OR11-026]|uniref:Uncharacterized protein n=1 Tax=Rhizopogon vinicolor AM-OR11-026 TaxID=1314800 RepID=A0A1B7MW17_9AGAM|nr:hypothetical protein K503DRAFT_801738 [Rhizopogon vinicolor AM-OR11-026]